MAFEDVNFMLEKAPGAYLRIGNGSTAPVHNAKYVSFRLEAKPVLEAWGGLGFCKADVLLEFPQMLLHQRNGSRGISALHARDDIRVFVMFAGCVAPRLVERDDERAARDDFLQITFQNRIVCKGLQAAGGRRWRALPTRAGRPCASRRARAAIDRAVVRNRLAGRSAWQAGRWPLRARGGPQISDAFLQAWASRQWRRDWAAGPPYARAQGAAGRAGRRSVPRRTIRTARFQAIWFPASGAGP